MFDLIKQQINLISVLEKDLSVTFKPVGEKNWAIAGGKEIEACPFCSHHDCFRVHYQEGDNQSAYYKCFSCGEKGDVISWRVKESKLKPSEAAKELAKEFGVILPNNYNPIQQVFNLAADYYYNCLLDAANKPNAALNGLTPLRYQTEIRKHKEETLHKFKVGFSDGRLIQYLESLGIDDELIESSGLKKIEKNEVKNRKSHDFLPANCFIYPHFVKGRPSHFTFKDPSKRIQYQLPKKYSLNNYLFYGQDLIENSNSIALVEGENDLLSVYENGGTAVGAIIGQISGEQIEWIRNNCRNKLIVTIFDPDDAGDRYREKLEFTRPSLGGLVHVRPPGDKDIDEHLTSGESLTELLKNTVKVIPQIPDRKKPIMPWGDISSMMPKVEDAEIKTDVPIPLPVVVEKTMTEGTSVVGPNVNPEKYQPPVIEESSRELTPKEEEVSEVIQIDDCSVIEYKNCYYKVVYKDEKTDYVRLSDFTLELKNVIIDEESGARTREVIIKKQNGQHSDLFEIDSETKVSLKQFKKTMAEKADAEWLGRESDLDAMWRLVYSRYPEISVKVVQRVGRHEQLGCWIFKNLIITDTGREIEPDKDGVFWISGKSNGIKIKSIRNNDSFDGLPILNRELSQEQCKELLGKTLTGLSHIMRNPGMALMALGWIYANVYSNLIYDNDGGFGSLMIWGTAGKGKSTVAGWLQKFFGISDRMASTSVQQLKTAIGFTRMGSFYASMPVLLDELRADEESDRHLGMIRSWYDREGRVVAEKEKTMVRDVPVRSTLMLAGEDLPSDPATRERCIMLRIPPTPDIEKEKSQDNYLMLLEGSVHFSNIMYYWLLEATREDKKEILSGIRKLDRELLLAGCSNRISKVWSSAGYFAKKLCDIYIPDFDFRGFIIDHCKEEQLRQKNDTTLSGFFNDLNSLMGRSNPKISDTHVFRVGNEVHIWFHATFKEINDERRGKSEPFTKNAVLRALREEPYFVSDSRKICMGLNGVRRTVITLDIRKCPEPLKEAVHYSSEEEEKNDVIVK